MKHAAWLAVAALAGCGAPDDAPIASQAQAVESGLQLEVADEKDLIGTYAGPAGTAWFASHAEWGSSVKATIVVGEIPIEVVYRADVGEAGEVTIEIGGDLGERERAILRAFTEELDHAFPYERDAREPNGATLRTFAGYLSDWSMGPTRVPFVILVPARAKDSEPIDNGGGTGPGGGLPPNPPPPPAPCGNVEDNDGVLYLKHCCNGGAVVAWEHDAAPAECFHTRFNTCGFNSGSSGEVLATNCPGRCGGDCWGNPYYTQDCLEHDLCLMHDAGQATVGFGASCSDEMVDAGDDVVFIYASLLGWSLPFHTMPMHTLCFF